MIEKYITFRPNVGVSIGTTRDNPVSLGCPVDVVHPKVMLIELVHLQPAGLAALVNLDSVVVVRDGQSGPVAGPGVTLDGSRDPELVDCCRHLPADSGQSTRSTFLEYFNFGFSFLVENKQKISKENSVAGQENRK